jgi:hypothetical protein
MGLKVPTQADLKKNIMKLLLSRVKKEKKQVQLI